MKVRELVPKRDKLEQLAEESAELGQAALKLIRAKGLSENPTPITLNEASQNFYDEFQDVLIVMKLIVGPTRWARLLDVDKSPKYKRWYERLTEGGDKH